MNFLSHSRSYEMIRQLFFLTAFILIFSHANAFANPMNILPGPGKTVETADPGTTGTSCLSSHYEYKKFRPETLKDLPFPPGAFVEMKKCVDETVQGKPDPSEEELNRAKIGKEEAVRTLSFLLSYIYHQQKSLAGSYKDTDHAYHDLIQKNAPIPKVYNRAVTNYEDALKRYGEYQAVLSAMPRAISDYEKKVGSSVKEFSLQKEDGLITMMNTFSGSELSSSLGRLDLDVGKPANAGQTPDEKPSESGHVKDPKEARKNLCMVAGGFVGGTVAEGIILTTLSNPMSALLGASLGATLCSEKFYEKLTLWPRSFGAKLVDMSAYIKDGLEEIGDGLYNIGKKYLYVSPSKASDKISEHFATAKSWLNRKLDWQ